jgi:hypothetical protein
MESLSYYNTSSAVNASPSTELLTRYFTVIQNVPLSMNREQLLSLLCSVGSLKSLQMINVQSAAGLTRRLGLVEVADNESVFRLTSRQFLVGNASTLIHKLVYSDSRIVRYFDKYPDLNLQVTFETQDTAFVSRVVKIFQGLGDIKIQSISSLKSNTTINFKAPRNYTIGALSTTLNILVDGIELRVKYQEETVSEESLQLDPDFWNDFKKIAQKPKTLISETARFFSQLAEDLTPCEQDITTPPTEEDDMLSSISQDDDDYTQFNEADIYYRCGYNNYSPSWVFQQEAYSLLAGFTQNLHMRLDHWHRSCPTGNWTYAGTTDCSSAKSTIGGDHVLVSHQVRTFIGKEEKQSLGALRPDNFTNPAKFKSQKSSIIVLQPASQLEDELKPVNSAPVNKTKQKSGKVVHGESNKLPLNKSKDSALKGSKKLDTSQQIPEPEKIKEQPESTKASKPSKKQKSGVAKLEAKNETANSLDEPPRSEGATLLSLISCIPDDYERINAEVMAVVHDKWRRFAEIKDQMRMEKYQEYLNQKKQEGSPCLDIPNVQIDQ